MEEVKVGAKIGRWLVLELDQHDSYKVAFCRCDCGVEKWVFHNGLRTGQSKSCGCRVRTLADKPGSSSSRLYHSWKAMMDRCYNSASKDYPNYGARGIRVCDHWHKLSNFLIDMIDSFKAGLTLDRKDNDGPYSPENCRWATASEQNSNRRNNVFVEVDGQRLTCAEWSRKTGISKCVISSRLRNGWNPKDAVTTPKLVNNKIRNSPRNHWIEFQGLRLTLADWSRKLGVASHTLRARLKSGMPLEKVMTKGLLVLR